VPSGPPPPPPVAVTPGVAKTPTGHSAAGTTAGGAATTFPGEVTTTSTTIAGQVNPNGTVANNPSVGVGPNTPGTLSALQASSSSNSGPTNTEALWALLEGASVCAIGLIIASSRKKSS
jgi:hypothetical protein